MQRKQAEQVARARAERIQAGAAVQQRVQTAKEEADKAREVSHSPHTKAGSGFRARGSGHALYTSVPPSVCECLTSCAVVQHEGTKLTSS